jgi:hypothetical protein
VAGLTRHAAALLLLALCSAVQAEVPTWHGVNGQPLLIGTMFGTNGQTVHILKPDKSTADIRLGTLSMADRAVVLAQDKPEFQRTFRQWSSASGTYHVDAKAILIDGPNVRLARADTKVVSVPIDKLSKDDRSYLDRLQEAIRSPAFASTNDDPFSSVESFTGGSKPPVRTAPKTNAVAPQHEAGGLAADPIVYVTKTGKKYHTEGCRSLHAGGIPMPLSEATTKYSPCSICHPPLVGESDSAAAAKTTPPRTTTNRAPKEVPSNSITTPVRPNPDDEKVTGHTATGIPTYTGPRGGEYHYSKSGKKVYERKK